MITTIQFKNFKVLRDTTLPLSQFTLIVGPNGSGKSTVFKGLQALLHSDHYRHETLATAGRTERVELTATWNDEVEVEVLWEKDGKKYRADS